MKICRSCGSRELSVFLSLGDMPLADGLLHREELDKPEPRYPLEVALCRECALVQILEEVPPEVLFCQHYPYYSSFADTLLEHSKRNAHNLIATRKLGPESLVVELASNDGYLLQYFVEHGIPVLGIDPAEGPVRVAREKGIPSLCEFFGRDLAERLRAESKQADVVLANNVLAHVADLNGFVAGIATLLKADGVAVIECPYVGDLIEHCEFDTIYHEHLCYYSISALDALFARHGMSLNEIEHLPIHGGSLRLYVEKRAARGESVRRDLDRERERKMTDLSFYQGFARRVEGIRDRLSGMMRELRGAGKRLAAYGAAAKGAILLNYVGIGTELIDFVADRNVHKQGKYMPGVHVPIVAPEKILDEMPDYVLLLPWNFKDEILQQQEEYRRREGKFIIPIPSPIVV